MVWNAVTYAISWKCTVVSVPGPTAAVCIAGWEVILENVAIFD